MSRSSRLRMITLRTTMTTPSLKLGRVFLILRRSLTRTTTVAWKTLLKMTKMNQIKARMK